MKPITFDGLKFAQEKEKKLKKQVLDLKAKGVYPHLASIIIGNNPASEMYVNIKKKRAEEIGIQVSIYKVSEKEKLGEILKLIDFLNTDSDFTGIMVQMPLPVGEILNSKSEILNSIAKEKDVDGLREDSKFLHPTSKAVIEIMNYANSLDLGFKNKDLRVCVIGATGMVGKPLVKELKKLGYEVIECDIDTKDLKEKTLQGDILISCTGIAKLIKADMVKDGVVVVDVGAPKGDVDYSEVSKKASFITPVPGGVGPVTISCLLENLIDTI